MTRCAPHGRTTQSLPCVKGGGIVCTGFLPCHSEPVTDVTGVGIRSPRPQARNTPRLSLRGRCQRAALTEGLSKRIFRAPARGTFALGGKSTQKRRSNLRFENPLRAFTQHLSRWCSPRERCAVEISPKCCIVTAFFSAAAFALKCKAAQFYVSTRKHLQKQRPKAATYLCRFAAKARFDNRPLPRVGFPKGRGRTGRKPSERKIV